MAKAKTWNTKKYILYVAIATLILLLIPFLAMQLQVNVPDPGDGYDGVNWTASDFIAAGVLLFGMGTLFVVGAARMKTNAKRAYYAIFITILLLLIWVELAVGIFD